MMRAGMSLLEDVEAIAREAGAAIMKVYARDFSASQKEDQSPLTEADTAAHEVIVRRLEKLQPALPILSEEAVGDFTGADNAGRYWLVDPLDGTREFIKRNGEFTVNIALIEHGRAILGVVYAPVLNVAYLAAEGSGAFKAGADGQRVPIRVAEHNERIAMARGRKPFPCRGYTDGIFAPARHARTDFDGKLAEILPGGGRHCRCLSENGTDLLVGYRSSPMRGGTGRRRSDPVDGGAHLLRRSFGCSQSLLSGSWKELG